MAPKVVYTVTNNIVFDQRIQKMAAVAESLGASVTIAGRQLKGDRIFSFGECTIVRFKLPFQKGFFFYALYNIRLFIFLIMNRFDFIIANDLDTLLPCRLISGMRRNSRLIFDSHEYFTGVPELANRPLVRRVWKSMERSILPGLNNVITVSDAISDLYREEYNIDPLVVRNCSRRSDHIEPVDRREIIPHANHLLAIIQGTGLNSDSGLEELVKAVEKLKNVHLLIIGSGLVLPRVKEYIEHCSAPGNFTVLPSMEWNKLISYTRAADIGFFLHKPDSPNPAMSMPNKLFEYISAGIGVIVSPVEGVSRLVNEFGIGVVLNKVSVDDISNAIVNLTISRDEVVRFKENSKSASLHLNWDTEKSKIEELYKSLFVI